MPRPDKERNYYIDKAKDENLAEGTTIARITAYTAGKEVTLTEAEEARFKAYKMVWDDITAFRPEKNIVARVERIHFRAIPEKAKRFAEAAKIVTEAKKLFVLVHPTNKQFERVANIQALKTAAQLALRDGQLETFRRCINDAAKLQGLFDDDNLLPTREMAMGAHTATIVMDLTLFKGIREEHEAMMEQNEEYTSAEEI